MYWSACTKHTQYLIIPENCHGNEAESQVVMVTAFFFRQGGITQVVTSIQTEHISESTKNKKEVKSNQIR